MHVTTYKSHQFNCEMCQILHNYTINTKHNQKVQTSACITKNSGPIYYYALYSEISLQ